MLPSPIAGKAWPTTGNGAFGARRKRGHIHQGADFGAPIGEPVWSMTDGYVEQVAEPGTPGVRGYGRVVVVRLPDGFRALYGHLSRANVETGQRVSEGMQLGEVGDSCDEPGNVNHRCEGSHVHAEIADGPYTPTNAPTRIDPTRYGMPDNPLNPREQIARWSALDGLIRKLYEKVPAANRDTPYPSLTLTSNLLDPDAPVSVNDMMQAWTDALARAPSMGAALRVSVLSDWVTRYNALRALALDAGLTGLPPKARDINRVATDVDEYIVQPLTTFASGLGSGLVLLAVLYVVTAGMSSQPRYARR